MKWKIRPSESDMPKPVDEIVLTLEPFVGTAANPYRAVDEIAESVQYWRRFVPIDGMRLSEASALLKEKSRWLKEMEKGTVGHPSPNRCAWVFSDLTSLSPSLKRISECVSIMPEAFFCSFPHSETHSNLMPPNDTAHLFHPYAFIIRRFAWWSFWNFKFNTLETHSGHMITSPLLRKTDFHVTMYLL